MAAAAAGPEVPSSRHGLEYDGKKEKIVQEKGTPPGLTEAAFTEEPCLHANVTYCLGQTELKGEDVVFLEHRRPWPGRDEESFCGSNGREEGSTTFHDGNCVNVASVSASIRFSACLTAITGVTRRSTREIW